jgi:hypothetical protein
MLGRSAWILLALAALWQQRPGPTAAGSEFRISGIVKDGLTGALLDRAEVSVQPAGIDTQEAFAPVITSAGGHFAFEHVAAGKYVLSARRRGYAPQNYEQHELFTTGIAVGANVDSENIVFRLLPQAAIVGQVNDDSGEVVRQAQVILFQESLQNGRMSIHQMSQAQTDDQGRYRFDGLLKGRYYVAVSARPWYAQNITVETIAAPHAGRSAVQQVDGSINNLRQVAEENTSLDVVYPMTYYAGATDSSKASALNVEPGATVAADFSLAAVPALHFRLTAPGLDLSRPYNLSVAQSAFGQPIYANTSEGWRDSESIQVVGVPPGEIKINVQSAGDTMAPLLFNTTMNATEGMQVNLNDRARGVAVSGIIKGPLGARLPEQTRVELRNVGTGPSATALLKPDGHFDFGNENEVYPGGYVPYLFSPAAGSNWYVSGILATGAKVSGRVVDLQTVDPVVLTIEISGGSGRVEGVALRDNKGFGGAMALLVSNELASKGVAGSISVVGRDQSDSDGTFAIANVPPGEYTVVAIQNGWDQEWGDPSVLQKWMNGGAGVTVAPNGRPSVRVNVQ